MSSAAKDEQQRPRAHPVARRDIKVLTADDNHAFRDALRDLIMATPGFTLVGHASTGEEAVDAAEALAPDLVLMDVVMPGMGGVAATEAILSRRPELKVVLISADDPALSHGAGTLGDAVARVRKQDLSPRQLVGLWESKGSPTADPPNLAGAP
jgi:two-component system, NarL family, invasion response regulator UvrY